MATANILLEDTTCSICFKTYTDPHILKCLHTFCRKCIKQMEKNRQKECPHCREKIKYSKIKQDCHTKGLVDSFNQQQTAKICHQISNLSLLEKATSPTSKCQVCHHKQKSIKCKCMECEEFMCSDCEKAHKGSKASQTHNIKQNKEIIKQSHAEITGIIKNLKKTKKNMSDKSSLITKSVDTIQDTETKQIADITKAIDNIITKLESHKTKLINEVKGRNLNITNSLKTMCEQLQKDEAQMQCNMDFLTNLLKSEDVGTLAEMVVSVKSKVEKDEGQISADLEARNERMSPVRVVVGGNWDPGMYIRVEVDEGVVTQRDTGRAGSSKVLYSLSSDFHELKSLHVANDKCIQKMLIINDEIWATTDDIIYIFNLNCEKVRNIKLSKIKRCRGLTECPSGVIVADEDTGLHRLNLRGEYKSKIASGHYSDVSEYGRRLYALECDQCRVVVFEPVKSKWKKVSKFSLAYDEGSSSDRICAHSGGTLVSSHNNHRLYLHSDSGALIQRAGERGSGQPGKLRLPYLCGVDGSGTALVADYINNCLQLYTAPSIWQLLTRLPSGVKGPVSAVVDSRAGNMYMWVATDDKLYKLKINTM